MGRAPVERAPGGRPCGEAIRDRAEFAKVGKERVRQIRVEVQASPCGLDRPRRSKDCGASRTRAEVRASNTSATASERTSGTHPRQYPRGRRRRPGARAAAHRSARDRRGTLPVAGYRSSPARWTQWRRRPLGRASSWLFNCSLLGRRLAWLEQDPIGDSDHASWRPSSGPPWSTLLALLVRSGARLSLGNS